MNALAVPARIASARAPTDCLDALLERLRSGEPAEPMRELVAHLAEARRHSSPEAWREYVGMARSHPLLPFVHRDPFASRCFNKPRGYAPDAEALDYVLRASEPAGLGDDPAAALHRCTTQGETARALRFRRDFLSSEIEEAALQAGRELRVFAAGAGYLRELDRLGDPPEGVGKLVAFDPDERNLEGVRREYPRLPLVAHGGTVRQLCEGKHLFDDMDLAYCAGPLESLAASEAQGLVRALFAMLAPGGQLILTHFLTGLEEAAFLEVFFDWKVACRTQAEVVGLVRSLSFDAIAGWSYAENSEATMGVAFVTRR